MDVWLCVLQRNARGMDLRSALCLLVSACWLGCAQMWFLLLLTHCDQWHSHLWKAQCSLLDRICHVMVCSQNAAALKYVLGLHWIQFLWVILPVSCIHILVWQPQWPLNPGNCQYFAWMCYIGFSLHWSCIGNALWAVIFLLVFSSRCWWWDYFGFL